MRKYRKVKGRRIPRIIKISTLMNKQKLYDQVNKISYSMETKKNPLKTYQ